MVRSRDFRFTREMITPDRIMQMIPARTSSPGKHLPCHADKNREDNIGITNCGNNTRFISTIRFGNKILTEQCS